MRKALAITLVLLTMPLTVLGNAFTEGKEFVVLPDTFKKSAEPSLTEVFSVYCGNCYRWEQDVVDNVKLRMTEQNIQFKQKHIAFVADYGDKVSEAIAITQNTELSETVKDALFSAVHEDKIGDWKSDDAFYETLSDAGLSKKEFNERLKSPGVQQKLAKWELYEQTIPSVPSFVVNGKYMINMNSLDSFDQFYALIDYLLEK